MVAPARLESTGVPNSAAVDASALRASARISSLDIMRGVVVLLMAIDHVRVYAGVPAGGPTAGVFFTRWITHFVAPAFAFLAGTGAFFHARKLGDHRLLARYLVTRGLVLLLLELTVIRASWTFNFDYAHYILAGVIWMLGWCMILLAALVRFRSRTIATFGLVVIFFQNVVGAAARALPAAWQDSLGWLLQVLYFGGRIPVGQTGATIAVLYSIVPWIGVMAVGYAFGEIMTRETSERRRLCLWIGLSATAVFAVTAGVALLGGPPPEEPTPLLFQFLSQRKYPASQLFLLMTLGPLIALIPLAERARGVVAKVLSVFGRVPMFYYLLHIPVIHVAALLVSLVREGRMNPWLFANHPMMPPPVPEFYRWGLPLLYLVWFLVVVTLYFPCQWFAGVKARRRNSWLRYI